jgi:hypothetical protein
MPSGRRASKRSRLALRIVSGRVRRSSQRQDVESVELDPVLMLAVVQRVEIGDAVNPEHRRLAIDHKLPVPVLQRGLDDRAVQL